MGYTTKTHIKHILAQALTSATDTTLTSLVDLVDIGNDLDGNLIQDDIIEQYIVWADEEINSTLSVIYKVPLCEKVDFETTLAADIDPYNGYLIVSDACPLNLLDKIIIVDSSGDQETHQISEIISSTVFGTFDMISDFSAGSRVLRVKYPDPIVLISTRLAAANIYDKYFASQSDPNMSDYGNTLRGMAIDYINNITNGRTVLHGQHRIGNPFVSPYLRRRYGLEGNERFGPRDTELNSGR